MRVVRMVDLQTKALCMITPPLKNVPSMIVLDTEGNHLVLRLNRAQKQDEFQEHKYKNILLIQSWLAQLLQRISIQRDHGHNVCHRHETIAAQFEIQGCLAKTLADGATSNASLFDEAVSVT